MQEKQVEWAWQWSHLRDDNRWLFEDWIWPVTLRDFEGKTALDCGCGGGQHVEFVSPFAREVVGVDLNALESARKRSVGKSNVSFVEADIASMELGKRFDIVYSVGVLHHTDNPTASFRNIARHAAPGARVIVWVYSREGNWLNERILEPFKRMVIDHLPRSVVLGLAWIITLLLYLPIYTIYCLPLRFLPFYEYFENWRKLDLRRNVLNVFDKLNAPQTWFISKSQMQEWFSGEQFDDVRIASYKGVSWRGSATKRCA